MKRLIVFLFALISVSAFAQSCTPGNGVSCTANLNLYLLPQGYVNWNAITNLNWANVDAAATNWAKINAVNTFTAAQTMPGLNITGAPSGSYAKADGTGYGTPGVGSYLPLAGGTLTGPLANANGTLIPSTVLGYQGPAAGYIQGAPVLSAGCLQYTGSAVVWAACNSGASLLPTANMWTLQQTFNQGILLSNNAPIQANNSSGTPGNLAYVDVSNNYYFGDIENNLAGTGYWYHAGSASLAFTAGAVTFIRPPVFGSFIVNGSQSITGVQGSSSTNLMLANSGTFTPGDCLNVAADGSAQDFGAACGSGSGGVVTALTTSGSSGAATLSAGTLNIPVYTGGGVADINLTVPALTIAGNGSFPQYPAAASTVSFPGLTTAMVPLCGFSGDPVITNGWGQVGGAIIRAWASASSTMSYRIINQTNVSITTNSTGLRCSAQ